MRFRIVHSLTRTRRRLAGGSGASRAAERYTTHACLSTHRSMHSQILPMAPAELCFGSDVVPPPPLTA